MTSKLISKFSKASPLMEILNFEKHGKFGIQGLSGSGLSLASSALFEIFKSSQLWILDTREEAIYMQNDLQQFLGKSPVLFYPATYKESYLGEADNVNILLRTEVLNKLQSNQKSIIVTYPDALFEKVISKDDIEKNVLRLHKGDNISPEYLNEKLFEYHFRRTDFVTEPGEFSFRGGIIDIFSYSSDMPYRIEFFGDDIESIRQFDLDTQLSSHLVSNLKITANLDNKDIFKKGQSFLEHFSSDTLIFSKDVKSLLERINDFYEKMTTSKSLDPDSQYTSFDDFFCKPSILESLLESFQVIELSNYPYYPSQIISCHQSPQPSFNKNFDLLVKCLEDYQNRGFKNYLCFTSEAQVKRFKDIFENIGDKLNYTVLKIDLHHGFVDDDLKICCFTDHEIFERYHKFKFGSLQSKRQSLAIKDYNSLSIGDYVTHIDHGIGRFAGLEKIDAGKKKQEAVKLIYGDRDILYVNIQALHKISKYSSKDGTTPKTHRLGSKSWLLLKEKAKRKVKEIAFDLIELYAKRKVKKGFACGPDTYLQHELEASFIYEDTPDQSRASAEVKADMESATPMDRLICGDVGFGKTEIAIRAAFKSADNGKQVVLLVPTTILAFQHYKTLKKRLKDLPVTIDYLNRFRSSQDASNILEKLQKGSIDIIIGTHQLINKKVKFKDLGLLIVDEEQKFGVAVKDKLKTLRENLDVLTLTATPIPRTLQFSLMSARDLSIMTSPPPNRYPVETKIVNFDKTLIRDAITFEFQRGGQVFFVNNRIENIKEVASVLQDLAPVAKIAVAHGQMDGKVLEKVMLDFMEGRYDILVSTSIIENGLDISNANTIFVNNAHRFGLSDLHQMRGRVGRSNRKAFCYLITIPKNEMTNEARRRINALEQFTGLGSGFNIAMRDLEIRGAGDLLGGEQSGFIADMGFDTYQKILQEAVDELKETTFEELYKNETKTYVSEVQIDSDFEILFPDTYINNIKERLSIYNQLAEIKSKTELIEFEKNLKDRFGKLPQESENLINSVRLKWLAISIGLERLILKNEKMIGYFVGDQQSKFYASENFKKLLSRITSHPEICQLKEKETRNGLRLTLSFKQIKSLLEAINALKKLL